MKKRSCLNKRQTTLSTVWVSFIVFLGIACSTTWKLPNTDSGWFPPTTATVCVDLPASQLAGAKEAVSEWNRAIGEWRKLEFFRGSRDKGDACAFWVHEVTEKNVPSDDIDARAWTSKIGGTEISMRKGYYEVDVKGILMHELGHALGAQHVAGTLMNPVWYDDPEFSCPDRTTVVQVAAWNHVDLSMMSWCEK